MKVLIIKNKLGVEVADDVKKAFDFLQSKTPIKFDVSYLETNITPKYKKFDLKFVGTTGTKEQLTPLIKGSYDIVIFMYGVIGYSTPDGTLTAWTLWEGLNQSTEYIEIPCSPYGDASQWTEHAISHEMLHALCKIANKSGYPTFDEMDITQDGKSYLHNDDPNHSDGNYARTLKNLQPYFLKKTMTTPTAWPYKYFKPKEVEGLSPKLIQMLDTARGIAGVPFVITSGLRSKEKNDLVGGVEDSSHLSGLAVDLLVKDTSSGGKMLLALVNAGFKRFGFYADGHLHVDISENKQSPSYWIKII